MVQNYRCFSQAPCVSMSDAGLSYVEGMPEIHKAPLFLSPLSIIPGPLLETLPPLFLPNSG